MTTGIVRRIDDLGRIVIPKEIRRVLKISEGDNLEINVDDDKIILRKYSVLDNLIELFNRIVDSYHKNFKKEILITDKEKIISSKNEYLNSNLSNNIKELMKERKEKFISSSNINVGGEKVNFYIVPLIIFGDIVGSIILICDDVSDIDKSNINFINTFLIKNIEE